MKEKKNLPNEPVNNKDHSVGVLKIMTPQRSNLVLSSNVPNIKSDAPISYRFNIETKRGNSSNYLAKLEL